MLEIERKELYNPTELPKNEDIIISKFEEQVTYLKDGTKQIKKIEKKINLTKKINETKKLIKNYSAEEKLQEIEKVFTK